MSASLVVDLRPTVQADVSVAPAAGVGSTPASGVIVGATVDMLHSDTYTNLFVAGGASISGQFKVLVQTSDSDVSGAFTDPTSGLAGLPGAFQSGGVLIVNSGNGEMDSGGLVFGSFGRPHRYARAVVMSGDQFNAPVTAGFIGNLKTIGSGAGFTYSPGSGSVNV